MVDLKSLLVLTKIYKDNIIVANNDKIQMFDLENFKLKVEKDIEIGDLYSSAILIRRLNKKI